jgi:integrase
MFVYLLGLRIHETMSLRINNIDFQNDLVTINESKFYKSRIEPFNEVVRKEIVRFLRWRKTQGMSTTEDAYLFVNRKGQPMNLDSFHDIFRRICEKAGIIRDDGAIYQPRIHDLRHTFAVNRLIAWYDAGENVQSLLPILSTYMGHTHLAHTSVYLTMTDRLLGNANDRFEKYVEGGDHE